MSQLLRISRFATFSSTTRPLRSFSSSCLPRFPFQHPNPTLALPKASYKVGVAAALAAAEASGVHKAAHTTAVFSKEFSLHDRVGIVSGANRGLGLEMAMALLEAGARAVYCFDLPQEPSLEFKAVRDYTKDMDLGEGRKGGRLEYICLDVTDQKQVWEAGQNIGDEEGRMDFCVTAAGILRQPHDCLEYPDEEFTQVLDVNVNGTLYTAQAAGRQMMRFRTPGSIILIASMSGSVTNKNHAMVSYNTSKSAVVQMARSMACELGPKNIRVNSLSPGYIFTTLLAIYVDKNPELLAEWSSQNPLGRIGRPDEVRGATVWLASDASSFCTGSDILMSGGHHSW